MKKPYPEYKPTSINWLSQVPKHWSIFRFKSLLKSETNGIWGDDPKGDENDILCLRVADFDRDFEALRQENNTVRNVSPRDYENRKLTDGDLLIEKSGGGELLPIGRVGIYSWEEKRAVCSNFMARLKPQLRYTNTRFLFYLFKASYAFRLNLLAIKQTTGIQNLDTANFFNLKISVPPLLEQTQIAKFLDHKCALIDTCIQKKARLIELLKEQKQALIERAITHGINPNAPMKKSGLDWFKVVPEHWEIKKAKLIFREIDIRSEEGEEELLSVSHYDGVKPRKEKDVNMFLAESYEGYKLCSPGDLVINIMWAWMGALGVSHYQGIVSSGYCVYRQKDDNIFNWDYLEYMVRLKPYVAEYTKKSKGIHSSRWRMYSDDFFQIQYVVPPREEQDQIIDFLNHEISTINTTISRIEREIELIKEYKTALIAETVTGKIDVRDWKPKSKFTNQVENVANL